MNSSTLVGFTPSPTQRGTLDILWSCLFTVFLCIWIVVHPNIPPPGASRWHRFLDRIVQIILAALAPELILPVAVREWLDARQLAKVIGDFEHNQNDGLSKRLVGEQKGIETGFYVVMGGLQVRYKKATRHQSTLDVPFTSNNYDPDTLVEGHLTVSDFKEHLHLGKIDMSILISESEMRDKGKADSLVKCLLVFQVLWLSTECIGRSAQHLATTPLEISTAAYVPFMLISLAFWWQKPYHVRMPTLVDARRFPDSRGKLVTGYLERKEIPGYKPAQYQTFGLVRDCLKVIKGGGLLAPHPVRGVFSSLLFFFFGGLHCLAWDLHFPTAIEQLMWRTSSVVVAIAIPLVWLSSLIVWLIDRFVEKRREKTFEKEGITKHTYQHGKSLKSASSQWSTDVSWVVSTACLCAYTLARLCLLIQTCVSLRSLPADCYRSVDWLAVVPHVI